MNPAPPNTAPIPAPGISDLVKALLLSLFVFPGLGHRFFGRSFAFRLVLISFLATFFALGFMVHGVAQQEIQKLQGRPPVELIEFVFSVRDAIFAQSEVLLTLKLLVAIYLAAPLELVARFLLGKRAGG